MFDVYLFSFAKKENSTARPVISAGQLPYQGTLKAPSSLQNPEILFDFGGPAAHPNYNYAYIPDWGKYYFLRSDWTNEGPLWRGSFTVDCLATYKDQILASTQFVSYSSVSGDAWLADTRIPVLKSTTVSSSTAQIAVWAGNSTNSGFYILSYIGEKGAGLVAVDLVTLQAIIQSISSADMTNEVDSIVDQYGQQAWTTSAEQSLYYLARVSTQNDILGKAYGQAPSCLRSCIWVPFAVTGSGHVGIYLGNYDTGQTGILIDAFPRTGSTTITIPWHYSDWRRGYCEQVYLYLPLVGMVSVSGDALTHTATMTINYSYTVTDGTISYQVVAGGEIIGTYGGSCAINYPLGVNQQASAGEVTQAIMQGVTQSVSAGITGNVSGLIMGLATASYNAASVALTSHPSCVGGIGGGAGSGLQRDVVCYTVAHDTIVAPGDMTATMGVPTMKPLALSSCSGYCQCANAHVSAPATLDELSAISTALNTGFYIE